jgi:hypothetical protein
MGNTVAGSTVSNLQDAMVQRSIVANALNGR